MEISPGYTFVMSLDNPPGSLIESPNPVCVLVNWDGSILGILPGYLLGTPLGLRFVYEAVMFFSVAALCTGAWIVPTTSIILGGQVFVLGPSLWISYII